jgi:glucosamine--fructose-6-phosphate aminotransferase (isomerizing)
MNPAVIQGPYLHDLLQQPGAVKDTLAALGQDPALSVLAERLSARAFARVVLTGMGSSLAALHPLALRLIEHGATAMIVDTSELIHAMCALLSDDTLVIAVSQSGRSAEIVRLASRPDRAGGLIAVTNSPDSPLAGAADATVLTRAGEEATVSCKTYVATLAALAHLGDVLCDVSRDAPGLAAAPSAMARYLERWEEHVAELAPIVSGVRDVFFAGRGASLAAAYTAGLIVKESTRCHAEGMTSAALRHGPMEMSADHVLALVYEGDATVAALNHSLAADLRRAGARGYIVGLRGEREVFRLSEHPPAQRAVLEVLPAQMLSLALAADAGIEAGRFVHASKVTSTE